MGKDTAERTGSDDSLLDAILEAAVNAVIVSDHAGRILRANRVAYDLFQYREGDLLGRNVSMLMPDSVGSVHDRYMRNHLETGERRIIDRGRDVEGRRSDGSVFPLHLSVGTCEVEGRSLFVGILQDLTERSMNQLAIARAQRLDAVGQMTGGIAHDFNNLLTVIIGNLELMEQYGLDERASLLVGEALGAAEMGAQLTERLMAFARRSDLKEVKTDLRKVCDETLAILKRTLGSGIRIRTSYARELSLVLIDPVQLQSALLNLALNARDAMEGHGELLISVDSVDIDSAVVARDMDIDPGRYIHIEVSDDGAGMDEEAQKRAFEPFFTTKSETGGTGLGLATVYGFVRQSGGHVTLHSELGFGTSFGLYFPALAEQGEKDAGGADGRRDAQDAVFEGKRILVVEDNPKVRNLSLFRLRALGFETEEAETGDKALAMLEAGLRVDLVFTDIVMPGSVSGYDLAERISSDYPGMKVLLTSGYASDVIARGRRPGRGQDILHKPFRQGDLVARLQALLADGAEA